jgi:hypothetical protein
MNQTKSKLLLSLCAACVFLSVGCKKAAKIDDLVPGAPAVGAAELWVTLLFVETPKEGDATDVRLELNSEVLGETVELDWNKIASTDLKPLGNFQGNGPAEESQPGAEPPLNVPLKLRLSLPYKMKVSNPKDLTVKADLYWAGAKRDSDSVAIGHLYTTSYK